MNGRDIINLQEAYLQVYSEPEISEEAEIAAEYFYEQGLDEEDVENLIEEIGIDEFNELVNEILESYGIFEASASQNWIAKQILRGMERHKQATQKLSQSKAGKALGAVERGLTTVGDVGFRAAGKAKQAVEKEIEKKRREQTGRYRGKGLGRETASSGGVVTKLVRGGSSTTSGPSSSGRMLPPAKYGKPEPSGQGTLFDTPPEGKLSKPLSKVTAKKPPKTKRETGKYRQVPMRFPKTQKEDFELWVDSLIEEGYDLSDYTWDELYEKFINPYEGKTTYKNIQGHSPAMKAGLKSDELMRTEPGSKRQKMQTRRSQQLNRLGLAAKQADIERKRKAALQIQREDYDAIVSHLLDEGYATSPETAENILLHMSEEWASGILDEARVSYSAKKARAGKDIGKPGRQFEKIAKSAAKRYGSKERGEKVAGAVLAKLRKSH